MSKRTPRMLILIVLAVWVAGCSLLEVPPEAEAVVGQYFEAVRQHRTADALALYSDRFFEKTTREQWGAILERVPQKLGELKSYQKTSWSINRMATPSYPGTYSVIVYTVEYSKGQATETITVYQPTGGGKALIVSHNISSMLLLD